MVNKLNYLDFIKLNGKPVSEINPGSDEVALNVEDALKALEMLKANNIAILGGDILSEHDSRLIYAYQLWGEKYHDLNWYCAQDENESNEHYLKKCYKTALESIINAHKIAENLNKKCYIVFVI